MDKMEPNYFSAWKNNVKRLKKKKSAGVWDKKET